MNIIHHSTVNQLIGLYLLGAPLQSLAALTENKCARFSIGFMLGQI